MFPSPRIVSLADQVRPSHHTKIIDFKDMSCRDKVVVDKELECSLGQIKHNRV